MTDAVAGGSASELVVERRDDGVAVVTLNRPKLNPLSRALLAELSGALATLGHDLPRALVVWGGERCFSAGADIEEFSGSSAAGAVAASFHEALDALAAFPRATVAAVSGYALGGGLELALACDFRVVGENARLGQPEILLGIIPGGGGTQRLARLIGPSRAKDLIFSGRQVGAAEALEMGLVNRVTSKDTVLAEALSFAVELARGPAVAQSFAKQAIDGGLAAGLAAGLALERRLFADVFDTEDAAEGIRSFRAEGPGKARFSGR